MEREEGREREKWKERKDIPRRQGRGSWWRCWSGGSSRYHRSASEVFPQEERMAEWSIESLWREREKIKERETFRKTHPILYPKLSAYFMKWLMRGCWSGCVSEE
jgi:hypothetical protein